MKHAVFSCWLVSSMGLLALSCEGADKSLTFTKDFLYGTAIAGFQADMGCPTLPRSECEDPNSDFFAFTTSAEVTSMLSAFVSGQNPSVVGPGFWELYEADLDRAANELSSNAIRTSLEWSRIFPTATDGVEGYEALRALASSAALDRYHAMFQAMRARGLEPVITINHYSLPTWLHDAVTCLKSFASCTKRGWLDDERAIREIAKFAGFAAQEFGAEVDWWCTINEPMAVMYSGYLNPDANRTQPPAHFLKGLEARTVYNAQIVAHARMYDAMKAADTVDADGDGEPAEVGLAINITPTAPKDPGNPLDVAAADGLFYLWNTAFLDPIILGDFDPELDGTTEKRSDLADRTDFVGLNYYTLWTVGGMHKPFLSEFSPLSTFSPDGVKIDNVYGKGIYELIRWVDKRYHLPVLITENGHTVADNQAVTERYLVNHLRWAIRARQDGAKLLGYLYWTLMDNYEWNHGMNTPLGLYAVDPEDAQKTRVARPFAAAFERIGSERGIPDDLSATYPESDE